MTSNRKIKRMIRSHMANTGLNYLEAKLTLEISGALPKIGEPNTALPPLPTPTPEYMGQVLAVTSSRGGTGKTTVALGLGAYLAHSSIESTRQGLIGESGAAVTKPLKVVVLDLSVRDGHVGFFTGNWKPTAMRLRRLGIDKETISETKIYDEGLKIDLMLAPRRPRSAEDLPPEFYVELIEALKPLYDYIILDTGDNYLDPLIEQVAYPMADLIISVTEPVAPSIFSMARWVQEVTSPLDQNGMNIPKRKIGIVVNKTDEGSISKIGKKIRENAQGMPIIGAIPSASEIVADAMNSARLENILQDNGIRNAFAQIAESVVGSRYPLPDESSMVSTSPMNFAGFGASADRLG